MFHLRNNTPLRILTIQEQTTHNVKFNIDTSTLRYNNLYMDFAQYLYRKCLLVDVWDADSRLLFGSLKIPLRGLLRQGKMSQHLLKEVDVLDTNFKYS
jgi:nephrocystin-4